MTLVVVMIAVAVVAIVIIVAVVAVVQICGLALGLHCASCASCGLYRVDCIVCIVRIASYRLYRVDPIPVSAALYGTSVRQQTAYCCEKRGIECPKWELSVRSTLRARGFAVPKTDVFVHELEELLFEISSRNKGWLQAYCNTNRGKTCFFHSNCKLKAGDAYKKLSQHLSQCALDIWLQVKSLVTIRTAQKSLQVCNFLNANLFWEQKTRLARL